MHDYQKNGITGNNAGTSMRITGNSVRGVGLTNGAAQDGIQLPSAPREPSPATSSLIMSILILSTAAATGIPVYGSTAVQGTGNVVGNTQFGIALDSASAAQTANNTAVQTNTIFGTVAYDGVDVCSDANSILANTMTDSTESGIHLDDECGTTGNNNTVALKTINEACAALLEGSSSSGNVI